MKTWDYESWLIEANMSFYKSTVVAALKELGYTLKQSDLKIGSKKDSGGDLITLNGESLVSSNEYGQMITWIKAAVIKDPAKYGLDPKIIK